MNGAETRSRGRRADRGRRTTRGCRSVRGRSALAAAAVLGLLAGWPPPLPARDALAVGTPDAPAGAPAAAHPCPASALLPGRSVLVREGRIEAVVPAADLRPPADADVLDAQGRCLIPGLWDMHVHRDTPTELPRFLANGVAGVRQMFGSPLHYAWRARQAAGELPASRQLVASRIVDGPEPVWPYSFAVAEAEQGAAAVRTALDEGADFIKVYSLLPRDAWRAVAGESRRLGVRFEGHVPLAVGVAEASDAGQATIGHYSGVLLAGSSEERDLHAEALSGSGSRDGRALRAARTQDPDEAAALHTRASSPTARGCARP
jgi:hypothetical protein